MGQTGWGVYPSRPRGQVATGNRKQEDHSQMRTSATYPSERAVQYARDLLRDREFTSNDGFMAGCEGEGVTPEQRIANLSAHLPEMTANQVSAIIDWARQHPKKTVTEHPTAIPTRITEPGWRPDHTDETDDDVWFMAKGRGDDEKIVPRGSYGLETPGDQFANDTTFFSVWVKDDGSRWTVRMYVSDERVKLPRRLQYQILDSIAEDPAEAAALYGKEIGKCGICSRKLTNDESRARGIGPVCAERWGW